MVSWLSWKLVTQHEDLLAQQDKLQTCDISGAASAATTRNSGVAIPSESSPLLSERRLQT